jgi:hypothetical protein
MFSLQMFNHAKYCELFLSSLTVSTGKSDLKYRRWATKSWYRRKAIAVRVGGAPSELRQVQSLTWLKFSWFFQPLPPNTGIGLWIGHEPFPILHSLVMLLFYIVGPQGLISIFLFFILSSVHCNIKDKLQINIRELDTFRHSGAEICLL